MRSVIAPGLLLPNGGYGRSAEDPFPSSRVFAWIQQSPGIGPHFGTTEKLAWTGIAWPVFRHFPLPLAEARPMRKHRGGLFGLLRGKRGACAIPRDHTEGERPRGSHSPTPLPAKGGGLPDLLNTCDVRKCPGETGFSRRRCARRKGNRCCTAEAGQAPTSPWGGGDVVLELIRPSYFTSRSC